MNATRRRPSSFNISLLVSGSFVIVWRKGSTLLSAGQQMISRDTRLSLIGYNLQIRDIRHLDQGDYTCQIGDGSTGDLIHTIEILSKCELVFFVTCIYSNTDLKLSKSRQRVQRKWNKAERHDKIEWRGSLEQTKLRAKTWNIKLSKPSWSYRLFVMYL